MENPRLSLALASGDLVLPASGSIALINPQAGLSLDGLPRDRLQVVQTFRPDYDAFAADGLSMATEPAGPYAAAIVCLPRAKREAQALIAQAATLTDGPLVVDGQKTDGIDSLLKALRQRGQVGFVMSKAHGKLIVVEGGDFADWAEQGTREIEGGFVTRFGIFSADAPDRASMLLAGALPPLKGTVADLGAGWGYLSRAILESPAVTRLDLVEADHTALECARLNVTDPRAQFHWADATRWRPANKLDAVVTNPPFHVSRTADPGLGRAFISAAAGALAPHGQLWLVANRHLPYEQAISALFGEQREVAGDRAFKVLLASRPRKG